MDFQHFMCQNNLPQVTSAVPVFLHNTNCGWCREWLGAEFSGIFSYLKPGFKEVTQKSKNLIVSCSSTHISELSPTLTI